MNFLIEIIAEIFTGLFGWQADKVSADRGVQRFVKILFFILAIISFAGVLYLCRSKF